MEVTELDVSFVIKVAMEHLWSVVDPTQKQSSSYELTDCGNPGRCDMGELVKVELVASKIKFH